MPEAVGRDTVQLVSALDALCRVNFDAESRELEAKNQTVGRTLFHSAYVPPISVGDYALRMLKYAHCGEDALRCAIVLALRYSRSTGERVSYATIHRMLITCVTVAVKMHSDDFYANKYYARVGGITACELNRLEVRLLQGMQYTAAVHRDELDGLAAALRAPDVFASQAAAAAALWAAAEACVSIPTPFPSIPSCRVDDAGVEASCAAVVVPPPSLAPAAAASSEPPIPARTPPRVDGDCGAPSPAGANRPTPPRPHSDASAVPAVTALPAHQRTTPPSIGPTHRSAACSDDGSVEGAGVANTYAQMYADSPSLGSVGGVVDSPSAGVYLRDAKARHTDDTGACPGR